MGVVSEARGAAQHSWALEKLVLGLGSFLLCPLSRLRFEPMEEPREAVCMFVHLNYMCFSKHVAFVRFPA